MGASWFEGLFGFAEGDYEATRDRFEIEGQTLRSRVNGRSFGIGRFETPTLAELRIRPAVVPAGTPTLTHVVIGDVLELHARPENEGALFQVASQFNCLEFAGPEVVPEDGVTGYAHDPTQGPACALAAAPATVFRNYFAPVAGAVGQTRTRQIDNLAGLAAFLAARGDAGPSFEVRNGYTFASESQLRQLEALLATLERDALLERVAIGLQHGVEVTFARRFEPPPATCHVSQAFCSALSCGYSPVPLGLWAPLATLVLDAAYEATLRTAATSPSASGSDDPGRPPVVWLTALGGGVFGNRIEWIGAAIARALTQLQGHALDVRLAHYRRRDELLIETIDRGLRS